MALTARDKKLNQLFAEIEQVSESIFSVASTIDRRLASDYNFEQWQETEFIDPVWADWRLDQIPAQADPSNHAQLARFRITRRNLERAVLHILAGPSCDAL